MGRGQRTEVGKGWAHFRDFRKTQPLGCLAERVGQGLNSTLLFCHRETACIKVYFFSYHLCPSRELGLQPQNNETICSCLYPLVSSEDSTATGLFAAQLRSAQTQANPEELPASPHPREKRKWATGNRCGFVFFFLSGSLLIPPAWFCPSVPFYPYSSAFSEGFFFAVGIHQNPE